MKWFHCLKHKVESSLKALPSSYKILIISISSPLLIGVYRDEQLIETVENAGKTSEVLLKILDELSSKYNYSHIIYTSGPGSYMAIKLTYITLRSLEILKNISFEACEAFELNEQKPIKAMGKLYFIKENNTIITKKFDEVLEQRFELPSMLSEVTILDNNKPLYILPAV
ncbi:MAG: TsaB protein, required for threonylcarbamoyladenosine (t(6)A) formation in tRNA [uncultured Sulfurovum sp.]|uniref:TsaB protein, required for threonylcarbamoyladenosine (T(6)A) formation in tRNA n=1 Tax=uncultured Sulfurovum sp. TaxID=269237 RepID=A0A6S6S405_9BACT|nr:MAG: TsaB protein, required for threonylcarbamoyladenosine (t(6)A) formation in tRNA [uncultured Sulfurovum sp.]